MTRSLHFLTVQHLSDEAVAAFADGVLSGAPKSRASQHIAVCADCAEAVREQRQASYALRAAAAPSVPMGLLDRLRCLPITTDLTPPGPQPSGLGEGGQLVFAAYTAPVPAPAPPVAPPAPVLPSPHEPNEHRFLATPRRVFATSFGVTTAAAAAVMVGVLASTAATAGGTPAPASELNQHSQIGQVAHAGATPQVGQVGQPAGFVSVLHLTGPR